MRKRQICVQVDEAVAKNMETIRDKTGIPVSRQIELYLKGFKIVENTPMPLSSNCPLRPQDVELKEGKLQLVAGGVPSDRPLLLNSETEKVTKSWL